MQLTDATRYEELKHMVEVKDSAAGFEPIAAFNSGQVATSYAGRCREANKGCAYRVMVREADGWKVYQGTS